MPVRTVQLPPRTPEQEELLRRHRLRLRLKLAKEGLDCAREHYAELRRLYFESLRKEDVDVN